MLASFLYIYFCYSFGKPLPTKSIDSGNVQHNNNNTILRQNPAKIEVILKKKTHPKYVCYIALWIITGFQLLDINKVLSDWLLLWTFPLDFCMLSFILMEIKFLLFLFQRDENLDHLCSLGCFSLVVPWEIIMSSAYIWKQRLAGKLQNNGKTYGGASLTTNPLKGIQSKPLRVRK